MPGYWNEVQLSGFRLPDDRPLGDLTAELTTMLGSADPGLRDDTAFPTLATWIRRGVYDDLLAGLGDGMVVGLQVGLGEVGTDTVFRRGVSARILGECLRRDNVQHLVSSGKVLEWGDRLAAWFLDEQDCRGHVAGKGWAHAIAHGADAIGVLGQSPHLAGDELAVLLDVLAERILLATHTPFSAGEPDRVAAAALLILRRNVVSLEFLESWIARIADRAGATGDGAQDTYRTAAAPQAFLRALFVQLSLAAEPPQVRPDLLLLLVDALRSTNAEFLSAPRQP